MTDRYSSGTDRTGQDRTGQDRTGQDRTGQERTRQERTGQWRSAGPVAAAVATRPWLWTTAVRQVFRLAVPGWWRRRPFLPLPDAAYLRFRLVTQYGDADHPPEPRDVVAYLQWCRAYRAVLR